MNIRVLNVARILVLALVATTAVAGIVPDGLDDPTAAKLADKCQAQIKKGGAKFVQQYSKGMAK
jgi:hypothetical protein